MIVHLDRKVGNLILSTPLIEITKKVFVNASVDILVAYQVAVLLESNPYLRNIFVFNHTKFVWNPFKLLQLILDLRKRKYFVGIESSNPSGTSFLNGLITYLIGAKYRIGFKGGAELFTNIHIAPDKKAHYYLSKQELVSPFSKIKYSFKPKLYAEQNEVENLRQSILNKYNLLNNTKLIGIWIGARDKKKWDIENFKSVYQSILKETNYFPILLFGIEETDEFNIISQKEYSALHFDDLRKLKNFISCCCIFISGDTGPLHFAYALGVSTVGIFLQDNYDIYGYSDEQNNFIIKPNKIQIIIEEIIKFCSIVK
jgi:heptosyltransferase-2/heptosyltransferase-3